MDREDIGFFDAPDPYDRPSRSERRRTEVERRKRRRRRIFLPLLVLVIIGGLGAGALIGGRSLTSKFGTTPDFTGSGSGEALVVVQPGDTATDIATTMVKQGVVKSEKAFAKAAKDDSRALGIQPGTYKLHKQMSGAAALALMLDPAARLLSRVTIPEGLTVKDTLALIASKSKIPLASLQKAAADATALELPSYAKGKPEGFLFPETYEIEPDTTAAGLLKSMVDQYKARVEDAGLLEKAKAVNLTPYELLTVGSLVEKETQQPDERAKVARVVYNRLDQDFFLGIDATILYGLGRSKGGLSAADLAKDTPYNNRIHKGLPPTPIANPGLASLQAAATPAAGPWLYYVLDADHPGHHLFTDDRDVFNAAKAKCQKANLC
ncbi:MAG TPA: endolytic transglycosylase MltG [Mycobacteriales bacterium]|nr:endolytic transglycosylase MltG [Mycobacteriales bacterium]